MKKFTRLWQLMMLVLLTSSVAIGQKQVSSQDKEALEELKLKTYATTSDKEQQVANPSGNAQSDALMGGEELNAPAAEVDTYQPTTSVESTLPKEEIIKSKELMEKALKTGYVKVAAGHSAGPATPNPNAKPLPFNGGPVDGGVAHAFDFFTSEAVTFDSDVPGTFNVIGPNTNQAFAGDFDDVNTAFWYYIDYGTVELYTVDATTGVSTLVAPVTGLTTGQSPSGMACDKNTGVVYVASTDIASSDLYTIDLTTGALTLIGSTGIAGLIEIAVDGHGTMYGWDIVSDQSFTIDKTTGVATVLGPLGIDLNYAQGGNYDPINNEVYMFAYGATGGLYTLNRANGMANLVGGFPGGTEVDGGGFPGTSVLPTTDGGATWVTGPSSGILSTTEVIEATFFNYGSTSLSNIPIQYTINAGTPVVENIPGPVAPGTGLVYSFTATADMSTPGNYAIEVCSNVTGDAVLANDCASKTVTSFAPFDCNWYIIGEDSYGDGWNGGSIDVYIDAVLYHSWTGPATFGPDQFDFGIYEGTTLDFVWNPGSWDSEVSYTIYNNFDELVYTSTAPPTTVNGIAGTCLPPPCPPPTTPTTDNITTTTARLNWAAGGSETMWDVEVVLNGATPTGTPTYENVTDANGFVAGIQYNLAGLTTGTSYDWYVRSDCGGDVSAWVGPTTFSTTCVVQVPPYTNNFDGSAFPACWTQTTTLPGGGLVWSVAATANAGGSPNEMDATWINEVGITRLITPEFDLTGLTNPGIQFLHFFDDYGVGVTGKIQSTTDGGATWVDEAFSFVSGGGNISGLEIVPISQVSATTQLAFVFDGNHFQYDAWYIDEVMVYDLPPCPDPGGLAAINVTETSADLTWTSFSGLSNVEWGPENFTPGTGTTIPGVTSPQQITGLTPSTSYDFYVQDDCGGGTLSAWVGPVTFMTSAATGELLYTINLEAICGTNRILAAEFFPPTGTLWVTASTSSAAGGNEIYEVDPYSGVLLNTYAQITASIWGMRDLANDGTYLYAGDEDGFYQIDPADGSQTTLFSGQTFGVIRALAYNPTSGTFWTKSFGSPIYEFDAAGNIVSGPFTNSGSAYGAAWNPNTDMLWLHMTSQFSADVNEFAEVDPATGLFTGLAIGVPDQPCPINPIVGGGFLDFGNMYPGRNIIGATLQGDFDFLHVVEFNDTGFPDQITNANPACGAIDIPLDGTITWDFGANTDTYDFWFGPAGAMVQVVSGATVSGPSGSYAYTGLMGSSNYEWRVDGYNATDLGPTMGYTYNFNTVCGAIPAPYTQDFEAFTVATNATGYAECWTTSPEATTASFRWNVDAGGTPSTSTGPTVDHTTGTSTGIYLFTEASSGTAAAEAYVYSPEFDLSALSVPAVSFWYHMWGSDMGELHLDISTDGGTTWDLDVMTPLIGQQQTAQADPYFEQLTTLTGYSGVVQFRFRAIRGSSFNGDMAIDDFAVEEAPACPDPSGLMATNIGLTTADLQWTENGTATEWDLYYGTAGVTPPDPGTTPTVENTTMNPYPFTGAQATSYEAWVRADCGSETSDWVGPVAFTLNCTSMTAGAQLEGEECGVTGINGGCNDDPVNPPFTSATPGTPIFAKTWADGGSRDTDWFELSVPDPYTQVTMEIISSDIEVIFGLIETATPGSPDCASASQILPNATATPCTSTTLDIMLEQAGTYWFFVGPTVFEGYPCYLEPAGFHYEVLFTTTVFNGPVASVDPMDLEATLPIGGMATADLTIGNTGDWPLDYTADIAYSGVSPVLAQEDFEGAFPPAGWSVVNNGGTCVWDLNTNVGRTNYAGGDGQAADADSDACGSGTTMDTELWTPSFDLTGATNPSLSYYASYNDISTGAGTDFANVDISTDGGTTWTNLLAWDEDHSATGPGELVNIDLSAYIGNASCIVRFHYVATGWDWFFMVDQVAVNDVSGATGWLSLDGNPSTSGSVPAGDENMIEVGFDATGIPVGTYYADINIETNEVVKTSYTVACTLNVTAGGYDITGQLTYGATANPAKPMDYVVVELWSGAVVYGQTVTDLTGNYSFTNVADGNYELRSATAKPRGGTNILDAINTRQFLGGGYPMNSLQQDAANVNNNIAVDILDAIFMQQSLSGPLPAGWTAPDYHFGNTTVVVSGGNVVHDYQSLCAGDPNASYTPPSSSPVTVLTETFDTEIPATWSEVQYSGTGSWMWTNTATTFVGSDGSFAQANDDEVEADYDVGLFTPSLDLSGYLSVDVIFDRNFQDFAGSGIATVNVYSGGTGAGNFEEELLFLTNDDPGGTGASGGVENTTLTFDPTGYADPANVYVEFYFTDEAYTGAWFFKIDNVEVIGQP